MAGVLRDAAQRKSGLCDDRDDGSELYSCAFEGTCEHQWVSDAWPTQSAQGW